MYLKCYILSNYKKYANIKTLNSNNNLFIMKYAKPIPN